MMMMSGDQLNQSNHGGHMFLDEATGQVLHAEDLMGHIGEDDGVFHYEPEHESLEDEIFELHTANKGDETDPANRGTNSLEMLQEDDGVMSALSNTELPHENKSSSSQKLGAEVDSGVKDDGKVGGGGKGTESTKPFEVGLDGVAVEAKCATSHEDSSDSRGNEDLLGMMNEELEHETELLYE